MGQQKSIQAIYQNKSFSEFGKPCDALLKTDDGTEFKVYGELLSSQSEFFKALFSMDEEIGESTVIHGIEPDILDAVLVYLYTGKVRLSTKNMMHLMLASDFLMIDSLLHECRRFVLQKITIENCVVFYLIAYRIKRLDIEGKCRRFLVIFFEKAVGHSMKEALEFPLEVLEYFLSNKSLNVFGEHAVWSFIEAWVLKDTHTRMPTVPKLLRCLSINEIDDALASRIESSPIIQNNHLYAGLKDSRKTLHYLSKTSKAQTIIIYRNDVPFITGVRLPPRLYFVTKRSEDNSKVEMLVSYDDSLDLWRKLGQTSCNPLSLLSAKGQIYVFAGEMADEGCIKRAYTYDLLKTRKKMKLLAPLPPQEHASCFVAEASGRVYVLGHLSRTCRRYCDAIDEWIDVHRMQHTANLAAVSLNGLLYVIGLTSEDTMVTQLYDPSKDLWTTVTPPSVHRLQMASAVYQDKIFLIGGVYLEEDDRLSREVEVYDPVRDGWSFYPELPFENGSPGTVVVKGRLFVYDCEESSSVAYWDGSGQWRAVNCPNLYLYNFCPIEDEDFVKEIMMKNRSVTASCWLKSGLEKEMQ